MHPVRRVGLVQQVTQALRAEITSGRWPVGERIPPESALCEMTGVGRNTVREAVGSLEQSGLVQRRQGSGTYVLATCEQGDGLGRMLSQAEHRDVVELRLALEVAAAELAADRRTPEDMAQLQAALARRSDAIVAGSHDDVVTADVELHRGIAVASHNEVLLTVYDSVMPVVRAAVSDNVAAEDAHHDDEHASIVAAIEQGDPVEAARAVRAVMDSVRRVHGY